MKIMKMNVHFVYCILVILVCGNCVLGGSLDLDHVIGRWYLIYADERTVDSFTTNTSCITADANRTGETSMDVTIWLEQNSTNITYDATLTHSGIPYTDVVNFTMEGLSEIDDVIKISDLDPLTSMYEYLIFQSRPKSETEDIRHVYVLSSSVDSDYEDEILEFLQQNGIDNPVSIAQGDECLYQEMKTSELNSTEAPNTTTEAPQDVEPIPDLNLNNMFGRWFQVLTNENTRTSNAILGMTDDSVCNIATFCQITDKSMSIYEQHWVKTPTGTEEFQTGKALQVAEGGVLNITLQNIERGIEWVVKVGEPSSSGEGEGQYSYVVVVDPNLMYLVVFAKDVYEFQRNDEVDVIAWLIAAGFTDEYTKPQIIYQDSSCPSPAVPSSYVYPASGCLPESGASSSYLVPFVIFALVAGFVLVAVASYYLSKRPRRSASPNYGRL